MSIFEELKRRNVFRVGIAYAIVAWLVVQIADVMIDNIGAPDWLFSSILLVLAMGFPVVLVFAWAFELTPEGLKREKEVDRSTSITPQTGRRLDRAIIVVLVLALGYFIYDKFSTNHPGDSGPQAAGAAPVQQAASSAQTEDRRASIAVLPFANMSNDPANEPFTLGIHDDLLTHLSRISALRTTSRTSVMQYRDTTKTIPEIAAELGVGTILEGGIQRSGNRVRINLQLIDAGTDEHLWAEIYDRELTAENLFDVQGAIATEVAKSLKATLLPEEEKALAQKPTESMAAYDLYLLGRHHWNQRTPESIDKAIEYFNQAIAEDPDYVLALSGLADAYVLAEAYGNLTGSEAFPKAEQAIERAMALDDGVSEVWASRGLLHYNQGDDEKSAADLEKAIELDPQNFSAWVWYGNALARMRRYEEALAAQQEAYSLEPMSRPANNNLAFSYRARGRFAESRPHFERADQLDQSDATLWRQYIADTYFQSGQLSRAAIELRQVLAVDPGNLWAMEQLRDTYLVLGDFAEAKYWVEQAAPLDQFVPVAYPYLLAIGDYEGAIAEIEDKLTVQGQRTILGMLFGGFRAASYGGQVETAKAYLSEYLGHVGGQDEVDPSGTWHWDSLEIASFMLEYGDASNGWLEQGARIRDEVNEGLGHLVQHGYDHPSTWFGLAQARILSGDQSGALEALGQAVEGGFRDTVRLTETMALQPLHGHQRFNELARQIEAQVLAERQELAATELEPFQPLQQRQPVAMSREQLERYTGYYTDGNIVIHFYLDEKGRFTAFPGQFRAITFLPGGDGEFFSSAFVGVTFTFHTDEDGQISHAILRRTGSEERFKVTEAPPPAIEVDREIIERYTGVYDAQLIKGQASQAATDVWTGKVEIDDENRVWIDWDNQAAKEIVPYSETEFYTPGFIGFFRFEMNAKGDRATRMIMTGDGTELVFERRDS